MPGRLRQLRQSYWTTTTRISHWTPLNSAAAARRLEEEDDDDYDGERERKVFVGRVDVGGILGVLKKKKRRGERLAIGWHSWHSPIKY